MAALVHGKPDRMVFTDASVFHRYQVAGWGGWAVADGQSSTYSSGPLPFRKEVSYAEAQAICEMIDHLRSRGIMDGAERLMIQSDSTTALNWFATLPNAWITKPKDGAILSAKPPKDSLSAHLCARLQVATANLEVVYLRHVRAHKGNSTGATQTSSGRHSVNERCDKLAKEAALAQRGLPAHKYDHTLAITPPEPPKVPKARRKRCISM